MTNPRWQELLSAPSLSKVKEVKPVSAADQLFSIIESGDVLALQQWVHQGGDVHAPLPKQKTSPLLCAMAYNQTNMVEALIELGCKINPKDPEVGYLWSEVAQNNNTTLLDLLYQSGARPWDVKNYDDWWNPKNWVIKSHLLAQHWLDKGYEVDFGASHFFKESGAPEFMWAIDSVGAAWVLFLEKCQDQKEVEHFYQKIQTSPYCTKYFDTALTKHWTVLVENNKLMRMASLIEKGLYYPSMKWSLEEDGYHHLVQKPTISLPILALYKNAYKSLQWFLESEDLSKEFVHDWPLLKNPPIQKLAWCNHGILNHLNTLGLDWSTQDNDGNTVLHCKAKDKQDWETNWKKWIHILNPSMNMVNHEGRTPLQIIFGSNEEARQKVQEQVALIEKVLLEKLPSATPSKPLPRL